MNRLFAFGCSFTKYYYPTWADLLSFNFDESYNLGKIGSGNQLISYRIQETNLKKKFTKDDTIIIMWSNFFREDEYYTDWLCHGNVFHSKDKYKALEYYVYRDCNIITSTLKSLSNTGSNIISTSINNPFTDMSLIEDEKILNILNTYKDFVTPQTKTMTELFWYPGIERDKTRPQYTKNNIWHIEDHPLPLEHCSFAKDVLQFSIESEAVNLARDWHDKIYGPEYKTHDTIFETKNTIKWIL